MLFLWFVFLIKEEELIPLKNNFKNFILMKKIIYLILCLATFSCSNENIGNDILSNAQEKSLASDNISKEEQMELFKESTSKYKTTEHNEFIDKFDFNYFDDYPIEDVTSNGFVIPIRKGKGIIETSILPISNKFYTIGIRQWNI